MTAVTLNRRMTLTAALACLLASTALYPLFQGSAWFYVGWGAIITVAACGALSRLRTLPPVICLFISTAGLLLYLNLVFEVRHSWLVIPTPDSIRLLWDLAGTGISDTRRYAPPAPELAGLVLIAAGGVGITAILTDLIAVRLRSAALAGLPLLVLFTVPITMNAQHETLGTAVVFCLGTVGYLAMLSADGRERIRVWGRLVSLWRSGSLYEAARRGPGRGGLGGGVETAIAVRQPGPDTRALAAAGRRVGLASIVLALCVPLIVPGLHASKLFSSGPGIGGSGGTAPAIALPDSLTQTAQDLRNRPVKVLTYTTNASKTLLADDPPYLQQFVYDDLTTQGWENVSYTANEVQAGTLPLPQGLANASDFRQFKVNVNVINDALTDRSAQVQTFLAMPYPAAQVTLPPGVWLADRELMVFSQNPSADVQSYQVTSWAVDPTLAQLNDAASPLTDLTADLQLPASYRVAALKHIADQITAGKTTELAKVNALAAWLAGSEFSYNPAAPLFDSAAGLINFLTKTRSGVCVQSAYAMTVLTRLLGYPARLAGGFTAGSLVSGNTYVVTTDDAHAWSEVYFSGFGWVKFEATPSGGDGTARASNYQGVTIGTGGDLPPAVPGQVGTIPGTAKAPPAGTGANHLLPDEGGGQGAGAPAKSAGTPWTAIALAVLAAIALACGVITVAAPSARRLLSAHPTETGLGSRRRSPLNLTTAVLVAVAAAIVALALYRLMSHTSGLNLRAGWATVGIAFGAACAVMFVAPCAGRIALRQWRWMRAADDAGRAHAAWREFRDDLEDLGLGYHPSEPPRTLADRVATGLPGPARDAVRRIALAEERASYAAHPAKSATLRRDGATARRGLAASVRHGSRWRARIFPASVVTALAEGMTRVPDRLAALRVKRALKPPVALLAAAPAFFHALHHPGAPVLPRPDGSGRPGLDVPRARGPHPGQVPPPAHDPPRQRQQDDRRAGRLEVYAMGHHSGHERADAGEDPEQRLHQLALVMHARIAGAHKAHELRIFAVQRLLDLLQLALLVFRERHDASSTKPLRPARVR
jgi:transglutaminase-like putative cysteine protease